MYLVTAKEMKEYDHNTQERFEIPACVLMERAAMAVVEDITSSGYQPCRVLVVAGNGNNGGDGLAIGRLLSQLSYEVVFWMPDTTGKHSQENERQKTILENYKHTILTNYPNGEYTIVIDALFGIGLSRDLTGVLVDAVDKINKLHQMGSKVYAIDIPSGIHTDTGSCMGAAVWADRTITFGFAKKGLYLGEGRLKAGEIIVADIGITKDSFLGKLPETFTYTRPDKKRLPARFEAGNKGTFGKVLLIAGSKEMGGACLLCADSILRVGAGMLKIITHEKNRNVILGQLPEAMLSCYEEVLPELTGSIEWADVLVIGPGIGQDQNAKQLLRLVIEQSKLPLVIDADGLNLLAADLNLQNCLSEQVDRTVIVTPHPGELKRFFTSTTYDSGKAGKQLAERLHCIVVAKDARTQVFADHLNQNYLNITGNNGMATAGSGDVLAGIIGGLLAQNRDGFQAACTGVYLHGLAGDLASKQKTEYGMIAGDIIEAIRQFK